MIGKEVDEEVKKIECNFSKWLELSNLTEAEFLRHRTWADFEIQNYSDEAYRIIIIGFKSEGKFKRFGEKFAYNIHGDLGGFEDLSLLLFYIAQRLDGENEKAPGFEQRENYFYNKVKAFIKEMNAYNLAKGNNNQGA